MPLDTYILFVLTTVVIVFSPGPAAIAIAAQGASHGGKRALSGVFGVASANVIFYVLSSTGIAALLIASHMVFQTVKWLGVGYLIWLGVTAIASPTGIINVSASQTSTRVSRLFAQGFVIELANPKALLYFAAILPQFIDPNQPFLTQILILGATTFVIDVTIYAIYGCVGARIAKGGIRPWMSQVLNKAAGSALVITGVRMAGVTA